MARADAGEPSGFQGIERAAAVLRALGATDGRGARLTDLAVSVGLSKSTSHRLLSALVQTGLVAQDESTGLFHLGFDLFALAAAAANRFGIVELAHEGMLRLAERTADTVYLSIRDGLDALCVDRRQGLFPIRTLTLDVGHRRPLGVGAGSLALLAWRSDEDVQRIVEANSGRLAAFGDFDAATLLELVRATRRAGYAHNDERLIPGMSAIGVPVLGRNGEAIAALSIAAISTRMHGERRATIVHWLIEEANRLQERLNAATGALTESTVRRLSLSQGSWSA